MGVATLVESAAYTANNTGTTPVVEDVSSHAVEFQLDVTAAATESGDKLNVYVQTTLDGTNWIDVVHFTEVLGDGGAKRYVAKIIHDSAEAMFETSATLSSGSVRDILGSKYRARWEITDASTENASFTFSVVARFLA